MGENRSHANPQRLVASTTAPTKKNPRKFYNHFLFKLLIVTIFLVIIPLFPSQPPNFLNPSTFTRIWELIHLICVGIAVSYGLFSRRNDENEDENTVKTDYGQSYLSKLLNVSSVFDEEVDVGPSGSDENDDHVEKMETWRSSYVRNEAKSCVIDKNSGVFDGEKPLLLPVRSLKSRVCDEIRENGDLDDFRVSRVYNRSNTSPIEKVFSRNGKLLSGNDLIGFVHGEDSGISSRGYGGGSKEEFSGDSKEIQRNGSGDSRIGVSIESVCGNGDSEVSRSLHRSDSGLDSRGVLSHSRRHSSGGYRELVEEKVEESVVLPSPVPWPSRSGRMEMRGGLDGSRLGRMEMKGELDNSTTSLLPPSLEESEAARLLKPSLSFSNSSSSFPKELSSPPNVSSPRKQSSSSTPSLEAQGKSVEDFGRRKSNYSSRLPPPPPPPPPPPRFQISSGSRLARSPSSMDKEISNDRFKVKVRNEVDSASVGKSSRTYRPKEAKSPETESPKRNSKASYSEYPKETRDFLEHVLLETDDESESESEDYREEKTEIRKVDEGHSEIVNDEGPDVDKKADEFIAKFREQIRLQRIESIKKSTGQLKRSSAR